MNRVSHVVNPKSASSSAIYVSGHINGLFINYAGVAKAKQQLTEFSHEVNQTGGERRVFDKGRLKSTCRDKRAEVVTKLITPFPKPHLS